MTEAGKEIVPLENIETFFKLSFKYSQGDPYIGGFIFKYAAVKGYLKDVPSQPVIKTLTVPNLHKTINPISVKSEISTAWGYMVSAAHSEDLNEKEIIDSLTEYMINRDLEYLHTRNRPKRELDNSKVTPDSNEDIFKSAVRKYVINGDPPGHMIFEEMFKDISKNIEKGACKKQMKRLVSLWETKHPDLNF